MRRMLLAAAILLLALVAPAAAHAAAPKAKPAATVLVAKATGDIKALTLKRIVVDRLSCALGAHVRGLDKFVVSDPVTITCRGGKLDAIRYAPAPPPVSVAGQAATTSPARTSTGQTSLGVSVNSVTTVSPGSSAPGVTSKARGPVAGFSAQAITVEDVTCPLSPTVFEFLSGKVRIGDVVSLSCTRREGGPNTLSLLWSGGAPPQPSGS